MFERFLARLSVSEYSKKFVIKGGILIASIVGLDTRSTMDLDTTIKNMPLTEENIMKAVKNICEINLDDNVTFETISIAPIRHDESIERVMRKLKMQIQLLKCYQLVKIYRICG